MTVHVFTSAAFNYIPKARLLFDSLRKFHPEWVLHLALCDTIHPDLNLSSETFDSIMAVEQLNIPNWKAWAFCHSIVELCTAIKPFALMKLLQQDDCDKVIYFDPDIVLFSRVDDIVAALDDGNICLTPHLTTPEEKLSAVIENEICALQHGVYNLGFIGVRASEEGKRFAEWWASRTYNFCRDDIPHGLFTDQRWIDMVPAFFEGAVIIRNPRHNVAPWNVNRRKVAGSLADGLTIDDAPLGFYHFTGFDSGAHLGMSNRYATTNAAVFELIAWYSRRTAELGKDPIAGAEWAFETFSNGEKIALAQRIVYRERIDLQAAFPDPFDANGFLSWWLTHGREEYPNLFANPMNPAVIAASFGLTAGFRAGAASEDERHRTVAQMGLRGLPRKVAKRGWEILRTSAVTRFLRS